jgi:mRNA interferase HigB
VGCGAGLSGFPTTAAWHGELEGKGCAGGSIGVEISGQTLTKSSQRAKFNRTRGDYLDLHVISRKALKDVVSRHADLESPLDTWYRIAKKAQWKSLTDVRKTYSSADAVGEYTVFNIKGNEYRLIVKIHYETGRIFIDNVLTHAEYDKDRWKS